MLKQNRLEFFFLFLTLLTHALYYYILVHTRLKIREKKIMRKKNTLFNTNNFFGSALMQIYLSLALQNNR